MVILAQRAQFVNFTKKVNFLPMLTKLLGTSKYNQFTKHFSAAKDILPLESDDAYIDRSCGVPSYRNCSFC